MLISARLARVRRECDVIDELFKILDRPVATDAFEAFADFHLELGQRDRALGCARDSEGGRFHGVPYIMRNGRWQQISESTAGSAAGLSCEAAAP
jgi:hypothetical protein